MRLTNKCLEEIKDIEERVLAEPEYRGKRVRALLRIDASDEKNLSQNDPLESDYFYMPNKHNISNLKKVDIEIDTDSDEIHEIIRKELNRSCCA
jgi:hypothetical protein